MDHDILLPLSTVECGTIWAGGAQKQFGKDSEMFKDFDFRAQ